MADDAEVSALTAAGASAANGHGQDHAALIAELRSSLAEAFELNVALEDDLRTAVKCMEDCEAERVAQVRELESRIDGLEEELRVERARRLQEPAGAVAASSAFMRQESLVDRPSEAQFARREVTARAQQLLTQAEGAKFRHHDSLSQRSDPDGEENAAGGTPTEVTLHLKVPRARPSSSASGSSGVRRGGGTVVPSKVPATRPRAKSPSVGQRSASATDDARSPAGPQVTFEGLVTADSERAIRQLQLEVHHLRQRVAMLQRQRSSSPRGRSPSGSPTGRRGPDGVPYSAARARLAQSVQETLLKGLIRAATEAREVRAMSAGLELKVRRRQVCASNAGASFQPINSRADALYQLIETLRQDGAALLRRECATDELLLAGAVSAGGPTGRSPLEPSPVIVAPPRRGFAPRQGSVGALSATGSDPASVSSPKWVLVDSRTVRVDPNAPAGAAGPGATLGTDFLRPTAGARDERRGSSDSLPSSAGAAARAANNLGAPAFGGSTSQHEQSLSDWQDGAAQ